MKILPLILGFALVLPMATWADAKPKEDKGQGKPDKKEKAGKRTRVAPPGQAIARERSQRPAFRDESRLRGAERGQQRAISDRSDPAARGIPGDPRVAARGVALDNVQSGTRTEIAVRNWTGPGDYDGRYWGERPRYQYNGSWFFYGLGPLPYYNNYDDSYPRYSVEYTGRVVDRRGSGGRELTARAQAALAEKGYYQGQVDGAFGPQSQRALRAFQRENGLPVTGVLDRETVANLGI